MRPRIGLENVVRVAVHDPDVTGGKFLDVALRHESRPVGLGFQDDFFGLIPVCGIAVVHRVAEVLQCGGHDFRLAVEHGHLALYLLQDLGVENHGPGVHGDAEFLHFLVVVPDQSDRHRIGNGIFVALIEFGIQVGRHQILEIRQLAFVERLQPAGLRHSGDVVRRWHHDVVSLCSRGQLGNEFLVVAVEILHHLALALRFEIFDRLWRDIVVPVVEMQFIGGKRGQAGEQQQGQQSGHG
jgi:hypothetical protein